MSISRTKVLLIGEPAANSLHLLQWLSERDCHCQTAVSYRDACTLLSRDEFELVLSQYQLPDRTAFPLLEWLTGSSTTLFLSTAVETGCLWLPMLERGKRCVGAPILRSSAFRDALQSVLDAKAQTEKPRTVRSEIPQPV